VIELVDSNGRSVFVAPSAIACVTEAGASSQWHGIRCFVRLFDGRVVEATQTAREVSEAVAKAAEGASK
jgi:hypothetical protein